MAFGSYVSTGQVDDHAIRGDAGLGSTPRALGAEDTQMELFCLARPAGESPMSLQRNTLAMDGTPGVRSMMARDQVIGAQVFPE